MAVDTAAARAYEENMVPALLGPWAERAADALAPAAGDCVLDVACGTGIGARFIATKLAGRGRVFGLDWDPAMLVVARQIAPALDWHCASALSMPYGDATFDACTCLQGLQFFSDRVAALAEMRRVLKPSGRLIATVWAALESNAGQHAIVIALDRQKVDTDTARKAFSLSDAAALQGLAERTGFREIEIRTEQRLAYFASVRAFVNSIAAGSLVFHCAIALLSEPARAQLIEEVSVLLRPYVSDERLEFPTTVHILTARGRAAYQ